MAMTAILLRVSWFRQCNSVRQRHDECAANDDEFGFMSEMPPRAMIDTGAVQPLNEKGPMLCG